MLLSAKPKLLSRYLTIVFRYTTFCQKAIRNCRDKKQGAGFIHTARNKCSTNLKAKLRIMLFSIFG